MTHVATIDARRCSCWPTAPTFEGEAIGADRRRRRHRRGRVQHRAVRLPGGHHRPVLRRADHHVHLPAHRQLRRRPPPTTRAGRPFCRGVVVRDLARRRSNWRSDGDLDALPAPPRRPRHRRHRHPPPHPPPPRRRRHARRVRHRRRDDAEGRGRSPSPAPTASTSSPRSPRAEPYTVGDGPVPGRRLRLRHQAHDPAPPRRASPPSRSCPASTTGRRRAGPPARRRVPLQRPRRPGDGAVRRRRHRRAARPRCRCSASASATSCSARALGARHVQAAVRPPRRQPPGAPPRPPARSRSPARTTTSRSPPTRSPAAPR